MSQPFTETFRVDGGLSATMQLVDDLKAIDSHVYASFVAGEGETFRISLRYHPEVAERVGAVIATWEQAAGNQRLPE